MQRDHEGLVRLLNLVLALRGLFLALLRDAALLLRQGLLHERVAGRSLGVRPGAHGLLPLEQRFFTSGRGNLLLSRRFVGRRLSKFARFLSILLQALCFESAGFRNPALPRCFRRGFLGGFLRLRERVRLLLREVRPRQASERSEREQRYQKCDACSFAALLQSLLHLVNGFGLTGAPSPLVAACGHDADEKVVAELEQP